jgi:DNA-binding NtrC family response regulator
VLETGEIQRVGSLDARHVDVHVLASTNRDLRAEVSLNRFRSDLFYRLNVVELRLPPLRRRPDDIPYLTAAFVRDCAARLRKPLVGVSAGVERLLCSVPWEGNVRELRNVVERACIMAEGEVISEKDVAVSLPASPEPMPLMPPRAGEPILARPAASDGHIDEDDESLASIEREHIVRTLRRAGGNKKAAARMLGLSRRALYRRLERHNLDETITRRRTA